MPTTRTRFVRQWFLAVLGLVVVGSVVTWFVTRDTLPREIRLATGQEGGLYHRYGTALAEALRSREHGVRLDVTQGSGDNAERLRQRTADLGIIQAGAIPMDGISVIAPLAPEVAHVIVRRKAGIRSISDLRGKRVAVGLPNSGMRFSAMQILGHYRITEKDLRPENVYFIELLRNKNLDAAVATTGIENPQISEVLATGQFDLLPIEDAEALEMKFPHFRPFEIPRGLYWEDPSVPAAALKTVTTTAYLACLNDASPALVTEMLGVLYESNLQVQLPSMIPRHAVLETTKLRWHPVARAYFDPFDQLGFTANVMESLAAIKELLVALGAALLLGWDRWRRIREARHQAELMTLKNRLDEFLEQTIQIERQLLTTPDPAKLQELLDAVSRVKLQALQELTHEDLRGDRMFSIFLLQCGSLSQALQGKLTLAQAGGK